MRLGSTHTPLPQAAVPWRSLGSKGAYTSGVVYLEEEISGKRATAPGSQLRATQVGILVAWVYGAWFKRGQKALGRHDPSGLRTLRPMRKRLAGGPAPVPDSPEEGPLLPGSLGVSEVAPERFASYNPALGQ